VLDGDVTLGKKSSMIGTLLAPSGNCMLDGRSKLTGAIISATSVTFEGGAKLTFTALVDVPIGCSEEAVRGLGRSPIGFPLLGGFDCAQFCAPYGQYWLFSIEWPAA
jgi:hypothetical protein